jgi:hypothetical protein
MRNMRRVTTVLAGILILALSGCADYTIPRPECPEGTAGMSLSSDIQPIFDQKCAACHSGSQSPDLSPGWSYDELTEGGYISEPDFACESPLYAVFSDTHSGRVTDEELLMILGWIQEGAQDN